MINFIVCGLEDTLLTQDNENISEETIELINNLIDNGMKFAVATGKNYNAVKDLFGKVKNKIIYICNDGGVVIYQDKVISKTAVDRLVCLDIVSELAKDEFIGKFQLLFSGERDTFVTTHDYSFVNFLKQKWIEAEFIKDMRDIRGEITKITIYAKDGFDEKQYEHFYKKWAAKANVAIADPNRMFVTGEFVTKGMAIALIQHIYEISPEDTVVFGSGYSDINMFEHSFYSYAMQWSDTEVKHAAKHITESVDTILEDVMRM